MIYRYIFEKCLQVDPSNHAVFINEPLVKDKERRVNLANMMFEVFNVPRVYFASTPAMAMYGAGKTCGVVVDIGETTACVTAVRDGFVEPKTIEYGKVSGYALTQHMLGLLEDHNNIEFQNFSDLEACELLKTETCYIVEDFAKGVQPTSEQAAEGRLQYELPDDIVIEIPI